MLKVAIEWRATCGYQRMEGWSTSQETGKAETEREERGRIEVVVAKGDTGGTAIDQEVASDEGIGPEAEKDIELDDIVRIGRRESLEIAAWRGRIGDIEAEVRIGEGAGLNEKSEEGVSGPEGVGHQKDLEEVDPQILENTEEGGGRVAKGDEEALGDTVIWIFH